MKTPPSVVSAAMPCLFSSLLLLSGPLAFAEEVSQPPSLEIIAKGDTWTNSGYVKLLTERCLETLPLAVDRLPDLEQCLKNSRLFSEVKAELPTPQRLEVSVESRWPVIALPIYMKNSAGDESAGVFVVHSNLFGQGKVLVLGALWSTNGTLLNLAAQDRSLANSRWRAGISASRSAGKQEFGTHGGTLRDAYKESRLSGGFNVGYEIRPNLVPGLAIAGNRTTYEAFRDFSPPDDLSEVKATASLRWRDSDYKLYFDEGFSSDIALQTQLWRSDHGTRFDVFTAALATGVSAYGDHALLSGIKVVETFGSDRRFWPRLGGGPSLRGFESASLWSRQALTASADYQIPLWIGQYGTWTAAPFIDGGFLHLADGRRVGFSTQGVGTYFFIKRVSIPGMGLVFCYNQYLKRTFVQFAIGGGGSEGGG